MDRKNKNIGTHQIRKFKNREEAQSMIDHLESNGRTIISGYFFPPENKWIIHFK